MTHTINVNLKKVQDNSYKILIGKALLGKIASFLKKHPIGNRYAIITDNKVKTLFGKTLLASLNSKGIKADLVAFKAGEQSKNLKTFSELIEKIHSLGLDRNSAIIALGGGVVGDIAGFVAATYMRGITYIQVPTTLLAMIDSSIGGKVAVDLKTGKNSCGSFLQPKKVFIDVSLLKNLPEKELSNGLAEVIKHAVIKDPALFNFLEKNINKLIRKDENTLIKVIERNCQIKAAIVEKDEKEKNLRKIVNYGHTIGHAIETLTNYRKFSHGESIAIGMNVEARISNKMGILPARHIEKQNKLLKKAGLSIKLPKLNTTKIINELKKDKKAVAGKVQFVLPERLGKMSSIKGRYGINVPSNIIRKALGESR